MIRTELNDKLDNLIKETIDKFTEINQEAVKKNEKDVMSITCCVTEMLDNYVEGDKA